MVFHSFLMIFFYIKPDVNSGFALFPNTEESFDSGTLLKLGKTSHFIFLLFFNF